MKKGLALPLILFIFFLIIASIIGVFLFVKSQNKEILKNDQREKQWKGLILTKSGLIQLDEQGVFEKDGGRYPIPDIKLPIDDNNSFTLREDGQLMVVGDPKLSSDFTPNTIYGWLVGAGFNFQPLFSIETGKKIRSYAFSPDNKQIAVTFVTRTSSETLDGIDTSKIGSDEIKKEIAEREKTLQEELRTITIYDTRTLQVVKVLQLSPAENPSRRTGSPSLIWNNKGLFVQEYYEFRVFDTNTWKEIGKIKNASSITELTEANFLVISPDGSSYYNLITLEVRSIPDNKLIVRLNAPEFITQDQINENTQEDKMVHPGFATFSNDSKKIIATGTSLRGLYLMFWELDLETGKTRELGDLYTLNFGEKIDYQWKKTFMPIRHTPSNEKVVISLYQEKEHTIGRLDYFTIKPGEAKTDYHERFTEVTGWPELGNVSFLGWYQEAN